MSKVNSTPPKEQRGQRGVALVLTLLVLTLLVVTGLEFNRAIRVEATLAGNYRDVTQASYIAQSGVEVARALIQDDDPAYDSLDERWAQFAVFAYLSHRFFTEGDFTGQIVDENSKFNPNGLIDPFGNVDSKKRDQLQRLLELLGHNPEVMDAILDWLDPDDQRRPMGAEREYYMALKNPYAPKNGPLDSLGEMLLIKGIDSSVFYGTDAREGVRNYLTVYSDGKININTASLPILMSLSSKVDQTMAQAVLNSRREKPFRHLEDLRSVAGWESVYSQISSEITVQSNYFSLEVQGNYHDSRAIVQTVIRRDGKQTRVLFWKAG